QVTTARTCFATRTPTKKQTSAAPTTAIRARDRSELTTGIARTTEKSGRMASDSKRNVSSNSVQVATSAIHVVARAKLAATVYDARPRRRCATSAAPTMANPGVTACHQTNSHVRCARSSATSVSSCVAMYAIMRNQARGPPELTIVQASHSAAARQHGHERDREPEDERKGPQRRQGRRREHGARRRAVQPRPPLEGDAVH